MNLGLYRLIASPCATHNAKAVAAEINGGNRG